MNVALFTASSWVRLPRVLSWDFVVTKVRQIPSSLSPKLPEGHRVFNRQWEQLWQPFSALAPGRVGFMSESRLGSTKS